MNIELLVEFKKDKTLSRRYISDKDITEGTIGGIGEDILEIRFNVANTEKDINQGIKALKLYKSFLTT